MTRDYYASVLRGRQIEQEHGLTVAEQAAMSLSDWSRLAYGKTPVEAALSALDAQYGARQPGTNTEPVSAPTAAPVPDAGPEAIDLANMDMATYAALRNKLISQSRQEGIGIMNSGAGTHDWIAAAQRQPGRSGWQGSNVEAPPDMSRRQLPTRPVEGRYSPYKGN
jgi:hypothetical protein